MDKYRLQPLGSGHCSAGFLFQTPTTGDSFGICIRCKLIQSFALVVGRWVVYHCNCYRVLLPLERGKGRRRRTNVYNLTSSHSTLGRQSRTSCPISTEFTYNFHLLGLDPTIFNSPDLIFHFTSLHFTSLHFTSLHFTFKPSLPFSHSSALGSLLQLPAPSTLQSS